MLRPVREDDVPSIARACCDPEIARWLPHLPQPYSDEDARSFVAQAIELRALGREMTFAIVSEATSSSASAGVRLSDDAADRRLLDRAGGARPRARDRGDACAHGVGVRDVRSRHASRCTPSPSNHRLAARRREVRVRARAGQIKGADDRDLWVFELARP